MSEKFITLVNGIEDICEVELLCAFEIEEFNSKYIIYTKDENDGLGHTIIYAGKIFEDNGKQYLVNIVDELEWTRIKEVMKEMAQYNLEELNHASTN